MQIEDLTFEDDARGYFENMSDLDAFIVAGSTTAKYITGAQSIPTSIWGASLALWAGVHSWSLG